MNANGYLQLVFYFVVLLGLAKPLGSYMARVFDGPPMVVDRVLGPAERLIYRVCGVDPDQGMTWRTYALAMMLFNLLGLLVVYALQRLQGVLPLNPQELGAVTPDSSFNTAVSFATNTNWQGYGGESTMSYLTQMVGLSVQNFVSAAAGIAVLLPLIRGLRQATNKLIGNFWVDLTRTTLYILLPLSLLWALVQVSQGVVQNFSPYTTVTLVQPTSYSNPIKDADGNAILDEHGQPKTETVALTEQTLPMGPAASQVAIKQLGTNGGGFYNVNSAHPYENPTPLSNFIEMLGILVISAALCYTFGKMVGDTRQGWAILAAMTLIFVVFLAVCVWSEQRGTPRLAALGADQIASNLQSGGNMEGKEVRFGIVNSALWATATTAASNGSVNAMHDSFTPLGGLVPIFMIQLGEVIYGGVGSGLYGMLIFAIVAVFVAGLMVGRTPEYLGKKIEAYEMKMASLVILIPPVLVLGLTALAVVVPAGLASRANNGVHGFSEILYAFSSMGNNNGSAFAGLNANVPYYNLTGGIAMLFARYWLAIPTLAIAGSLAQKKLVPASPGTLPTHTPLFVVMLIGVVIIVGALTFIPALALGPIVEHLMMLA
ncbi:MAG: potassium-transporting ATPase subunit KdpA [Deltaproteobacteria bacterium]|nr:potassium-transporting ATPase subunit KdpA [Deltaproteobacteria bacterium]MBI3391292.1 potassium-transporting ATPase subunit KdpA [Deltaproteobacteria bacterium]